MDYTLEVVNKVLPIILLILLGKLIQKTNLIPASTMDGFKTLVVNVALPAVLFVSFLQMTLKAVYLWFVPLVFGLCVVMLGLGYLLKRWLKIRQEYFPFMVTGFEYGMLGVSLYGAVYGLEQISTIAVFAFGHELFIWFLFVALLVSKQEGGLSLDKTVRSFMTSPVILAILLGVGLNLLGLGGWLMNLSLSPGIFNTMDTLGRVVVPMVLLIVGYGIQFNGAEVRYALLVTAVRLAVVIPFALLTNHFIVSGWMGLGTPFEVALLTLVILPPPFIVTLYLKPEQEEERRSVDNTLTLHTLVSIVLFILIYALIAG